jgi:DNA-binding NtrC family response regulator
MAHVLLVDDDPDVRSALGRFISRQGHQISHAADAAEGVAALQQGQPDLIITDMEMPGGTGFVVLDAGMKASIPVVILTAHASVEMAVEAMRKGAANFLTKPFSA